MTNLPCSHKTLAETFHSSRKKVQRAAKHIGDLNQWITEGDFHLLSVNQETKGQVWLTLFFDLQAAPSKDAAVIIGDALHNLRSALDILWHDVIRECGGRTTEFTKFPICDTADKLKSPLGNLLKEKQIEPEIETLLLHDKTLQSWELRYLGFA